MARARIFRDIANRSAVASNEVLRKAYRYITRNETIPAPTRRQAQLALNALPLNSSPTHLRNRCLETGRAGGVFREHRLCRYRFRLAALAGELPGVKKASW